MNVVSSYKKSFDWNLKINQKIITKPHNPTSPICYCNQDNDILIRSVQLLGLLPDYNSATISTLEQPKLSIILIIKAHLW
jgi:hypothetical protein